MMKYIFSILFFLNCFVSANAETKTYHIELTNWPQHLKGQIREGVKELAAGKECWKLDDLKAVQVSDKNVTDCYRFVWFQSDKDLKPTHKGAVDEKLQLTYQNGKVDLLLVRRFDWDGRKLRRIMSSEQELQHFDYSKDKILQWALK